MFGPQKRSIQDVFISSFGSFIAGFIGSVIIIIVTFLISGVIDIPLTFETQTKFGTKGSTIFPMILSLITLLGLTISMFLNYYILNLTNPEKYKKNIVIYGQIGFFSIFTYLLITPIYIYIGLKDPNSLINIFIIHVLIIAFGMSLIIEILNNYKYILSGIYGSFLGLFFSILFTIFIYTNSSVGYAKLISLIFILPIVSFLVTFFKNLFEFIYFNYYKITNMDQLGDIFYKIESEEKEKEKLEEEKNMI